MFQKYFKKSGIRKGILMKKKGQKTYKISEILYNAKNKIM